MGKASKGKKGRYFLNNISINRKLILINISIVLISISVFTFLSYNYMRNYVVNKTQNYEKRLMTQVSSSIDSQLEELNLHTYSILTNRSVTKTLKYDSNSAFMSVFTQAELESFLVNVMFARRDISSIHLFDMEEKHYGTNEMLEGISFNQAYENAVKGKGKFVYLNYNKTTDSIPAVRLVKNESLETVGVLIINIRQSSFQDIINKDKVNSYGNMYLLNANNEVLAATDNIEAGKQIQLQDETNDSDNNGSIITIYNSKYNGWKYVDIVSEDVVLAQIKEVRSYQFILGAIIICLFSLISYRLAYSISKPIVNISEHIKEIQIEGWTPEIIYQGNDEIGYLNGALNSMMKKIKALFDQVYKEEILKEKQKFKALQAQVNPHFLYNTLDYVNWTARANGVDEIGHTVKLLSDILRYSLSDAEEEVSIEEELEITKKYISIQKYRYQDKLKVNFDMDNRILDEGILRLTLQPIVENAFKHGFTNNESTYRLDIVGRIVDNGVKITIQDNGRGIDQKTLEKLLEEDNSKKHLGIYNVNERIKMKYGKHWGLCIESDSGKGTKVTVSLPLV